METVIAVSDVVARICPCCDSSTTGAMCKNCNEQCAPLLAIYDQQLAELLPDTEFGEGD